MGKSRESQVPSVGRMVYYYTSAFNGPLMAWICAVDQPGVVDSPVNLVAFNPFGDAMPLLAVPYGEEQYGHWGWPVYVPPVVIDEPDEETAAELNTMRIADR